MESPAVFSPPGVLERYFTVDEQGTGLRATWRPAHGFANLSLWRNDTCVETFHLTPAEAASLIAFLAGGLAALAPSSPPPLRVVADQPRTPVGAGEGLLTTVSAARRKAARTLERVAVWLRS